MADEPPKGFPGGYVPVVGEVTGDGEVKPRSGNRMFTPDEMEAAFGPHPWADWKPVIRRNRRRR